MKNFRVSKDTIRMRNQSMEWKKIFSNYISKTLTCRINKELVQFNNKKQAMNKGPEWTFL